MTEQPLDQDIPIPGVRRAVSRTGRLIVTASVAVAMLICIVAGWHAMSAERERRADEARRTDVVTAAAAPPRTDAVPLPAPPVAGTLEPTAAPSASGSESEVPRELAAARPSGGMLASTEALPVETAAHPGHRSPLVAAAEEALVRGATDRALVLAGQAVAAEPTDADAWLTLAAAHRAAGDDAAARVDYRNCIAQAHSEAVNHCRVLAAH